MHTIEITDLMFCLFMISLFTDCNRMKTILSPLISSSLQKVKLAVYSETILSDFIFGEVLWYFWIIWFIKEAYWAELIKCLYSLRTKSRSFWDNSKLNFDMFSVVLADIILTLKLSSIHLRFGKFYSISESNFPISEGAENSVSLLSSVFSVESNVDIVLWMNEEEFYLSSLLSEL